jgi:small nuclear ribonucleoprotein (snRNP)-like protein|tara:strand:+ start:505 stop:720 length:216 start_codon:yes stop_codon:yes gene_type:complete
MEGWTDYIGKSVFIKLRNNRAYSGKVIEVEKRGDKSLIIIIDKFSKKVAFFDSEISVLEEEDNGKRSKKNN